ncbi:MAG: TolC family protein [Pirellulaceae bacterium]
MNSTVAKLTMAICFAFALLCACTGNAQDSRDGAAQAGDTKWQVADVLEELKNDTAELPADIDQNAWWTPYVTHPINPDAQTVPVNVGDLMLVALDNSAKINVARALPQIRETAITVADATFDWNLFVDSNWNDTSEPVGSSLTVGLGGTRFRDHKFAMDAGFRRKLFSGAEFYTFQRVGHQNSNSNFFVPNDQATSRVALGFTQPLLRGGGKAYNTSLIVLAEIDTGSANDEFHRQLQSHLLEVARGYWSLYLERANLAQRVSLYLKTRAIAEQLQSRANIDAQQSQIISANAALASRRSDLIRSRAAVKNAETRLRALLNAPALDASSPELLEMIPTEAPETVPFSPELSIEFEMAMQHRPEVAAAIKGIRAACVRMKMADHEILPTLNFVTETYVSGLRGQSDIGNAWADQFRVGEPSYSIGLKFEVPLGRRAAFANRHRREIEVYQLREQYRSTLELVRAEVEVAVREVRTSWRELGARDRSRQAAVAEALAQEARWEQLGDRTGTGGLLLESLLAAQERVTQAEYDFAKARVTYNLALINLRHANGTLFQMQQLSPGEPAWPVPPTPAPEGQMKDNVPIESVNDAGSFEPRVIHPEPIDHSTLPVVSQPTEIQPVLDIPDSASMETNEIAPDVPHAVNVPELKPTNRPVEHEAMTPGGQVWK